METMSSALEKLSDIVEKRCTERPASSTDIACAKEKRSVALPHARPLTEMVEEFRKLSEVAGFTDFITPLYGKVIDGAISFDELTPALLSGIATNCGSDVNALRRRWLQPQKEFWAAVERCESGRGVIRLLNANGLQTPARSTLEEFQSEHDPPGTGKEGFRLEALKEMDERLSLLQLSQPATNRYRAESANREVAFSGAARSAAHPGGAAAARSHTRGSKQPELLVRRGTLDPQLAQRSQLQYYSSYRRRRTG